MSPVPVLAIQECPTRANGCGSDFAAAQVRWMWPVGAPRHSANGQRDNDQGNRCGYYASRGDDQSRVASIAAGIALPNGSLPTKTTTSPHVNVRPSTRR
jgi:hypothetical protein